jgi:hypothetical protein
MEGILCSEHECEGYGGQVTFLWIEVQVMITTSSDDNDKHERRTVMSNEVIRRDET